MAQMPIKEQVLNTAEAIINMKPEESLNKPFLIEKML
jgi:hypothetical protein